MCSGQNISLSLHHPLSGILRSPPLAFWFETSVCARVPGRVSVCLAAPPPFPESSTQLDSECALRPHIMPNFCEGASQSIWSVFVGEKGGVRHGGGRLFQKYTYPPAPRRTPPPSVLSELPSNKRRSQSRDHSQDHLSVEALSRQHRQVLHYYLKGPSHGGMDVDQQEASQAQAEVTRTGPRREQSWGE